MAKEEVGSTRFRGPSDAIDMDKLEKETQKLLFLGLLVAVSLHAAVGAFYIFKKTKVSVAKPLSMELIVRRPRMKKAFEFKKQRIKHGKFRRLLVCSFTWKPWVLNLHISISTINNYRLTSYVNRSVRSQKSGSFSNINRLTHPFFRNCLNKTRHCFLI